ncbi:GIY-YIG nuclease family protein [Rahnella sp. PCH160]|uniref:GIY-YIG nuclease family protein n=1 Tax=Rahnella sp. PCH160 TaxID=3447928 RepID=UPI0039FC5F1A
MSTSSGWFLYMLRTPTGMLYTGITTDVARRLGQHQSGKGAKALRGKGELALVFHSPAGDRSLASRLEIRVKKLSKVQKEVLVKDAPECLVHYLGMEERGRQEES